MYIISYVICQNQEEPLCYGGWDDTLYGAYTPNGVRSNWDITLGDLLCVFGSQHRHQDTRNIQHKSIFLNRVLNGRDCTEGWYKENNIWFLSWSMAPRSPVWSRTEWDISCENISSLIFLSFSSLIFPSSHLGPTADVLPIKPIIATSFELEVVVCWGHSKRNWKPDWSIFLLVNLASISSYFFS